MARDTKISAAEHCYRTLSRKIIGLELKPNEPIGEHAMAELLGVSRTPVREALSRLSAEGLVDLRSRAGVVVAPIRMDAVRTAQFVREQLELAIVAEAARQSNRRILLGIRQAIEEQELAIQEDNPDLFFECDERMHALYCSLAGRDGVWGFISDAKKHMDRVRRLSVQAGQLDQLVQDHQDVLEAVTGGDMDRAQEVMKLHLRRVMLDLGELSRRFSSYFEPETVRTTE
ncbi:GntR family transcriptional regulator [Shinella sp. 838]|jgi:DNA-binding GntR family transcriptional regulator|uniref:GntR family transcriptional regulator n=1 Tax=unclassified Shinella TaxID=2643062 RepID=UPI000437A8E8|nr:MULTISPECIES: GntR family transcriptional regulator [unclassified Shinella]EYR82851.1 transcriptional regulator [Shinella sp. DD12]MCA0338916.1 GntR family transcriptional regulator [Pseudomonadota bacterium]MDG4673622.1 GntR family transcriptional regulator [Shinella sp. 838]TAA55578.1 GntR family transcriptional regulator [Shinella sp. JR1-6]